MCIVLVASLIKEELVTKSKRMLTIAIVTALVSALGGSALSAQAAQDKYTLKVPGGLAFSEFRGYEAWQVVSVSQDGPLFAVILANPVMIAAYRAGVPGNGKAVPRRLQDGEDPLEPDKEGDVSRRDGAGHAARRRLHGEGQQQVRRQRRVGMGRVRV